LFKNSDHERGTNIGGLKSEGNQCSGTLKIHDVGGERNAPNTKKADTTQ